MSQKNLQEEFLSPRDVAELLGVVTRTLQRWHALGVGPPRCKVGRRVLYRRNAVLDWLKASEQAPVRL
ncbi:MAG: helix-turn-helix domain-containing protein [Pseudomonadota bacterium]